MELLGHQGDVCVFAVKSLPQGLVEDAQTKAGILAYGAASGHAHQVDELSAATVFKDPATNLLYLDVNKLVTVSHGRARGFDGKEADTDYHNPITLQPGLYAAGIVEETDWLTKVTRRVID